MTTRIDGGAVIAGAVADALVLGPVVVIYVALRGLGVVHSSGVPIDVTAVIGALVAPLVGGLFAGRQPSQAPLTNGAAAAAVASIAYLVFRIVDGAVRHRPLHVASAVILVIIAATLGMIGGWVGFRTRRGPPLAESTP